MVASCAGISSLLHGIDSTHLKNSENLLFCVAGRVGL